MWETPEVGRNFDGYVLEEQIGEGATGLVFSARDHEGREVAVKVIKPEMATSKEFTKRFSREVGVAKLITHSNLVRVVAVGEHEGAPYMVQELMSGGSLAERIENRGPMPLDDLARVCADIASALDSLHQRGLVHRDLKPANVLFSAEDEAMVADLGLIKDLQASMITKPGQALGTMAYMSPEQVRGEAKVGPASDIYALGCVAFTCLAGRPPFAGLSGMKIMWAHLKEDPGNPSADRDDVPPNVADVVGTAMAKAEDDRHPSAGLFAHEFRAAAGVA